MYNPITGQETLLKTLITDVFQDFFYRYKKDNIYAFVLEVDELFDIQYFTISTESSIFGETEHKQQYLLEKDKWNMTKWRIKQKDTEEYKQSIQQNKLSNGSDTSILQMFENILPNHNVDEKYALLIEQYQQAIQYITKIYHLNTDRILFLIHSSENPTLAINQANELNPPSSLLFEFIADSKIDAKNQQSQMFKLSQADKDILIDLAQIVNITEPYDPLFIAHHAYLLTLDAEFSEVNLHIQNLIKNISATDGQDFSLDKDEVLNLINQFYQV